MGHPLGGDLSAAELAFEHLPALVWLVEGADHVVVAANRAARASVGGLDLLGMPIRLAGPVLPGTRLLHVLDEVYHSGEPGSIVEPDALTSVRPVTKDDTVTGLVVQVMDMSQPARRTDREVTLDLQRVVLPEGLPVLPEVSMAAAYLPAAAEDAAGGDWFEVVPMPGRRLGLVVGDVVGNGTTASAVMGQLRAITTSRLSLGDELSEVMDALDAFASTAPDARGATVCVAVVDRNTGRLEYCTRGHPPPVVVSAGGDARVLPQPSLPPLAFGDGDFMAAEETLWPGETVVLYSNGMVERPSKTIVDGIDTLVAAAGAAVRRNGTHPRNAADRVCQTAVDLVDGGRFLRDDASLLAVTVLLPSVQPLELAAPAKAAQLTEVRHQLGQWLMSLQLTEDDLVAVELSVIEAVTNSIEHAYPDGRGTVHVKAALDDRGRIRITVSDTGVWKPPDAEPGFRGRGLLMMRESMDEMRLSTTSVGTEVEMAKIVRRPVRAHTGRLVPLRDATTVRIETTSEPGTVHITVAGWLDTTTAPRLRSAILEAARGGRMPITLVLNEVTVLGSAGLRVLIEQGRRLADAGRPLRVVARPTSPAGNVLAMSGADMILDVRPHA
ncbi:SpoIIE family protein phosphatase [Actinocrispum wychmicini]|uniref:Anti-anti-sigma factor n=1 Tax=Actinocrispum wychmicini TaxID=1213861 RepID=A0A4R2J7H0_9PSEU|nr:SpoIIE family protein phosphatase [Actinocrispum wychmicini]TCO53572.1 anti-anti-sigma factor [Actinocrispum wychmicini]